MAKILVVDDKTVNRELVAMLIKHRGHQTLEAADGAQALLVVRTEHPELVISDVLMPTMDGYEFVRQLRADPAIAATEVIFYSAHYREREARNLAQACGVSRVLVKPCEPEDILHAIDQALEHATDPVSKPSPQDFDREHLRLMADKLTENVAELEAANRRRAALIDLNLHLASERDPRTLLDKVCRGARDLIGAKYAVLSVTGPKNGESSFFTSGIETAMIENAARPQIDQGVLGMVCAERRSRRLVNPDGDVRAVGLPMGYPPLHSCLAAPVSSLTHVYGWLCLADKLGSEQFSDEDEHILATLAAQVGRIYENGSLYREVQHHAEKLQVEIVERRRAAENLEKSELRFRQMAENVSDVFYLRNIDSSQIYYVSPVYERIWGRTCDSLYANPASWAESIHPEDVDSARVQHEAGQRTGKFDYEFRIVRPDGEIRWIQVRGFPILDDAGVPYRTAGVASDVTQRKQADLRIKGLNRLNAVLSSISSAIVRVSSRDELFTEACRIAVDAGQFRIAWIGITDRSAGRIVPIAAAGTDGGFLQDAADRLSLDENASPGSPLAVRAVVAKAVRFTNDVENEPYIAFRTLLLQRGSRSMAALPLIVANEAVGVVVLAAADTDFFDAEELKLLAELAGNIAFALDHIEKRERLDYLAHYDVLTGLPNRTLFHDWLVHGLRVSNADAPLMAVALLDLERFRRVNETLGRAAGDELLRGVAARLLRSNETVARIGADTFALSLHDLRSAEEVSHVLDAIVSRCFSEPFPVQGQSLRIACRTGVALFPADGADAESLLRNAEAAIKNGKLSGDRQMFYASEMNSRVAEALAIETRLRRAVERHEFVLHYQPKVSLRDGHVTGVEALIRWQDPERGLVPPGLFIPILEETGMIAEIGRWAVEQALTDLSAWTSKGLAVPRVAVNVSAIQLQRPDFVASVIDAVQRAGDVPEALDLEITESLIMRDVEASIRKLQMLRGLGIRIDMDDFGTGHSSLSYIARLPLDKIKIDRSFIVGMGERAERDSIVSGIVALVHSLGLRVVAEGIETEVQARRLAMLGCDEAQGFYYSRPVPWEQLAASYGPVAAAIN
jgi:diguanylate cyclase (GGDEF)-like protein/PAS domain S-box-containing protein